MSRVFVIASFAKCLRVRLQKKLAGSNPVAVPGISDVTLAALR